MVIDKAKIQEEFKAFDFFSTKKFSLENNHCYARVVDIYDGDTCMLVIPIHDNMYKFSVRLYGIDTYEMKSKKYSNKAVTGRNKLLELVVNRQVDCKTHKDVTRVLNNDVYLVWVECLKMDKYGRVLVNMYNDESKEKLFKDVLLSENLGCEYYGGTKVIKEQK